MSLLFERDSTQRGRECRRYIPATSAMSQIYSCYSCYVTLYDGRIAMASNTDCTTSSPPCSAMSDEGTKHPENGDKDTVSDVTNKVRR
jgi:hypothetical protein